MRKLLAAFAATAFLLTTPLGKSEKNAIAGSLKEAPRQSARTFTDGAYIGKGKITINPKTIQITEAYRWKVEGGGKAVSVSFWGQTDERYGISGTLFFLNQKGAYIVRMPLPTDDNSSGNISILNPHYSYDERKQIQDIYIARANVDKNATYHFIYGASFPPKNMRYCEKIMAKTDDSFSLSPQSKNLAYCTDESFAAGRDVFFGIGDQIANILNANIGPDGYPMAVVPTNDYRNGKPSNFVLNEDGTVDVQGGGNIVAPEKLGKLTPTAGRDVIPPNPSEGKYYSTSVFKYQTQQGIPVEYTSLDLPEALKDEDEEALTHFSVQYSTEKYSDFVKVVYDGNNGVEVKGYDPVTGELSLCGWTIDGQSDQYLREKKIAPCSPQTIKNSDRFLSAFFDIFAP